MPICGLCGEDTPKLLNGHTIPKFAIRWLKKTSPSKRFRDSLEPSRAKQDGDKVPMFCPHCDQVKISSVENAFASNDFHRWAGLGGVDELVAYNEAMASVPENTMFSYSLALRSLLQTASDTIHQGRSLYDSAVEDLKQAFLNRKNAENGFFVAATGLHLSKMILGMELFGVRHRYIIRTFGTRVYYAKITGTNPDSGSTLFDSHDILVVYTKLPGFAFVYLHNAPRIGGILSDKVLNTVFLPGLMTTIEDLCTFHRRMTPQQLKASQQQGERHLAESASSICIDAFLADLEEYYNCRPVS